MNIKEFVKFFIPTGIKNFNIYKIETNLNFPIVYISNTECLMKKN